MSKFLVCLLLAAALQSSAYGAKTEIAAQVKPDTLQDADAEALEASGIRVVRFGVYTLPIWTRSVNKQRSGRDTTDCSKKFVICKHMNFEVRGELLKVMNTPNLAVPERVWEVQRLVLSR